MAIRRQIGLRDFHVSKLVTDDETGATFEKPVKIAGIISATMSTERTNDSYYSDDAVEESYSSFNLITLEVEISNISQEERALLLGQRVSKGVSIATKDDTPEEVGIMFRSKRTNGDFRYVSLPKGRFIEPSESYGTESDSVTAQTMTLTFTGIPLVYNGVYKLTADEGEKDLPAGYLEDFFAEQKFELPTASTFAVKETKVAK